MCVRLSPNFALQNRTWWCCWCFSKCWLKTVWSLREQLTRCVHLVQLPSRTFNIFELRVVRKNIESGLDHCCACKSQEVLITYNWDGLKHWSGGIDVSLGWQFMWMTQETFFDPGHLQLTKYVSIVSIIVFPLSLLDSAIGSSFLSFWVDWAIFLKNDNQRTIASIIINSTLYMCAQMRRVNSNFRQQSFHLLPVG